MPCCKLCQNNTLLIKAHIIPRGFYTYLYPLEKVDNDAPLRMVRPAGSSLKSRVGEYDENILCTRCDSKLGTYDQYAQKLFLRTTPKPYPESTEAEYFENVNFFKLKMFVLSLLWRGSVSERPFFNLVSTGPYEEKLRVLVLNNDIGSDDNFPFFLARFKAMSLREVARKNILVPRSIRLENKRFVVFYLPNNYKIYVKVDGQSLRNSIFERITLREGGTSYVIIEGTFEESPEFAMLTKAVQSDFEEVRKKFSGPR